MIKLLTASVFIFLTFVGASQNHRKVSFGDNPDDYFLEVEPASHSIKTVLVLMPGFGQLPESIFPETKIHNVAYLHDILVVAIGGGPKLYLDDTVKQKLDKAMSFVKETYGVQKDQFVIGGFSAGGTINMRYTEYCYENPDEAPIQPLGVFSVDSPIDLFHIWNYFQREIAKDYSDAGVGEAKFVTEIMEKEIGNPTKNKSTYDELTPFDQSLNTTGNERFLKEPAVRVYHDIDIAWQLTNRRRSLIDTNAFASSELINRLLLLGNDRAEFIQSDKQGYRSAGFRHPHSWSIVDELELIQWVKELAN